MTAQHYMTFSMMIVILEEVRNILQRARFIQMQEMAPFFWILFFDKGSLLVCMKGPFARFHLTKLALKGRPVLLTQSLHGEILEDIELINQDRILSLIFPKNKKLVFEFTPGGKIHLTDAYSSPPRRFNHVQESIQITSHALEENTFKAMEQLWREKWRSTLLKKKVQIEKEIDEGSLWQKIWHEAELLQTYFFKLQRGMKEIECEDWKQEGNKERIELNPLLEPYEELQFRFKKARKLKRKKEIAEKRLKELQVKLENPPPFSLTVQKNTKFIEKKPPYRAFTTQSGLKIYVGKKDSDNDTLTFSFAHGLDYWFHAANSPGSHVILKTDKNKEPDSESIEDALQLALYYSKSRGQDEEVIMTQCKYLSKQKRAKPGLVHVSKHRKIYVRINPERIQNILDLSKKNHPS